MIKKKITAIDVTVSLGSYFDEYYLAVLKQIITISCKDSGNLDKQISFISTRVNARTRKK